MHPEIPDSNLNEGIEMRPLESYITVLYWFDRRKRPGLSINSNKKSKGSYSKKCLHPFVYARSKQCK